MEFYLLSFTNYIAERVAASGEQEAVFDRIDRAELFLDGKGCGGDASWLVNLWFFTKLIAETEGKFPGVAVGGAVAVGAFYLHIGQRGG